MEHLPIPSRRHRGVVPAQRPARTAPCATATGAKGRHGDAELRVEGSALKRRSFVLLWEAFCPLGFHVPAKEKGGKLNAPGNGNLSEVARFTKDPCCPCNYRKCHLAVDR
ncbi:hypothetical protein BHE74_00029607 [Ensete ventricosum]|nr:hypothetical protein GW17_00019444 [Ensete ventricosum]RWW63235.1 hypothetical protein BHE74_00029607 [Ensete ventricosum]RZR84202.1 hypothetical protein BHM03_00010969 [Ensete ventricosum]